MKYLDPKDKKNELIYNRLRAVSTDSGMALLTKKAFTYQSPASVMLTKKKKGRANKNYQIINKGNMRLDAGRAYGIEMGIVDIPKYHIIALSPHPVLINAGVFVAMPAILKGPMAQELVVNITPGANILMEVGIPGLLIDIYNIAPCDCGESLFSATRGRKKSEAKS